MGKSYLKTENFTHLYRNTIVVFFTWMFLTGASLVVDIQREYGTTLELVRNEARATFNKDLAFRLWVNSHGGVYIPPNERTPPNPYLKHVAQRDLITQSGEKFTLMNPAYALRQIMEEYENLYGVKGHITSLKLTNPINRPDQWELKALSSFGKKPMEYSEIVQIEEVRYMRLMRPLITQKGCLKCHGHQEYKVGDVRGGVSVAIPMKRYKIIEKDKVMGFFISHGIAFTLGSLVIGFVSFRSFKRLEETRLVNEERMRLVTAINQVDETVIITDIKGHIQYVNPAFEKITGYSPKEVIGQNLRILKSGKQDDLFYENMWESLLKGQSWRGHLTNKSKYDILFEEEVSIAPIKNNQGEIINFVAVKRDVTKELKMESQLLQAQKLESLGTLAGGIAHDFNNILSPILGFAELSMMDLPQNDRLRSNLDQIYSAANRAKELVAQILAFSRQSELEKRPIQISLIIKEALQLIRASLPSTIVINKNIRSTSTIYCDPTQIHQIIMNLCTNAYHAMGEKGGTLTVSLTNDDISNVNGSFAPGEYQHLMVSDTGHGMSKDTRERIFEPYFTTKKKEKGTGLGLSVTHGIIKSYKGYIAVESVPGEGSRFDVYFPIINEHVKPEKKDDEKLPTGNEHIIVVDDEPSVAILTKKLLSTLGYRVSMKTSSTEALEVFKADPGRFDLMVTDMTMPGMTGDILAREMLLIRPNLSIIICTGYSKVVSLDNFKATGANALLMKPVSRKDLAMTIRKLLDAGSDGQV